MNKRIFAALAAASACLLGAAQAWPAGDVGIGAGRAAEMAADMGELNVTFEGLRSAKGVIRACLTRDPALFLKCDRDPEALKADVAASPKAQMLFRDVPPGDYVLAVVHDENGNAKVDTLFGIPREGVGFSRNPVMTFGPPKYKAARFHLPSGESSLDVTLKYFL